MVLSSSQWWAATGEAAYVINNSVIMDSGSSNYFTWAGTGQSQTTYTFSMWVKFTTLGTGWQGIVSSGADASNFCSFRYRLNQLEWGTYASASWNGYHLATPKLRDPSAWYHIVTAVDTTSDVASMRQQTWINGELITAFDSATNYTSSYATDINQTMALGSSYMGSAGDYLNAYIAEFHYLDGTAGVASDFGTENSDGVWIPSDLTAHALSYGTNGSHLNFENASNLGEDSSGNGNDWTVNNSPTQTTDTPTDSGSTIGNYATFNPLIQGSLCTLSNGNSTVTGNSASNNGSVAFTQYVEDGGLYYYEITMTTVVSEYPYPGVIEHPGEDWINGSGIASSSSTLGGFHAQAGATISK